jgi:ATP-binding cassette subfamily B protein
MQKEIGFLDVTRFVWGYFVHRPLILLGVICLTVAISATEVAMPYFVGEFTDLLAPNTPKTPELAAGIIHYLLLITAAGVAYWILRIATHYTYDYFLKFPAMRDAATDGFRRVTAYSTDWHVNTFAGSTVRRISRGMWAVERFADQFYGNFFPLGFVMIGTLIMLALRWPLMGGVLTLGVLIYVGISVTLS